MESFEVLPAYAGTLESMDSEFSNIPDPQQWTCSGLHSALPKDASEEEIQRLIFELTEDNRLLRESLQSSSSTMKSQLSSIIAWYSTMAQHQAEESQTQDTESVKLQLKEALIKIDYLKQEIGEQYLKIKSICEENEKEKNLLKSKLVTQEELNSKSDKCLLSQAEKFQEKMNLLKLENVKAINQLVSEVRTLEEKLGLEQKAHEVERLKHQEDKKLLRVIQSNYDKVAKQLQMQTRSREQKDQVDLLTPRLLFCEQWLEQSEAKVNMNELDLAKEAQNDSEPRMSQDQVDLLTSRLFDCEQRLEQSEAKVNMNELDLAKEAKELQVKMAAAHQCKKEQVDMLTARLSECRQRLGKSKEEVNRLTTELEVSKEELHNLQTTSKLRKQWRIHGLSKQREVDQLTVCLSDRRQQLEVHQAQVRQLANELKLARKELEGHPLTQKGLDFVTLLQERLSIYNAAIQATGDGGKIRRYERAVKAIKHLLTSAMAGESINEDDIPPPVYVPPHPKAMSSDTASRKT